MTSGARNQPAASENGQPDCLPKESEAHHEGEPDFLPCLFEASCLTAYLPRKVIGLLDRVLVRFSCDASSAVGVTA
jgi:hypothetical protein